MEFPVLPEPGAEPEPAPAVGDPADPPEPRPTLTVVAGGGDSTADRGVLHAVPRPPADRA